MWKMTFSKLIKWAAPRVRFGLTLALTGSIALTGSVALAGSAALPLIQTGGEELVGNISGTNPSSWVPPLESPIKLINQYRQPNSDYSAGHRGVDYLVKEGQLVLAPADGFVWFSGKVVNRNLLSLVHEGGYLSEFEPACTDLQKGEPIFAGQEIGWVCQPDNDYLKHCQSAICLHFSLRRQGAYLSPLIFIGGLNPSRLLPQQTQ